MSLGPPFDDSGANLQRTVGVAVTLLVGALVATMVILSGRTLGRGGLIHVAMATPGPLRDGAKVRIAGREIGEVRGISPHGSDPSAPDRQREVEVNAFIEHDWMAKIPSGSEFFVSSPSILGEAYLEIGAPPTGRDPGAPLADGLHVRGVDPPEIDRFLEHSEANLRLMLALLRDNRPEIDELFGAVDHLLGTLSGISHEQLVRIEHQFEQSLSHAHALLAAVREAGGPARIRAAAHELYDIADKTAPDLKALGERIDLAMTNLAALDTLMSPERRTAFADALTRLRSTVTTSEQIFAEVQALIAYVDRGKGTLGGILHDRELYDDLHETHRILKSQPWSLILKTEKPRPITPAR